MSVSIPSRSRLNFAELIQADGVEFWEVLDLPEIVVQPDDIQYTALGSDRIDRIAYKHYGDPVLWWVIAAANGMELLPDALCTGQVLRIPAPRYVLQQLFQKAGTRSR